MTNLTGVEVVSSLHRRLPAADGAAVATAYLINRVSGTFGELAIDEEVFERAVHIAEQYAKSHKLKSLDILHLATAVRHAIPVIATFDKNLRQAALALGLAVLPA